MRALLLSVFFLITWASPAKEIAPDNLFPQVKLETSMGVIVVELDRTKAPITVNNFLRYVVNGRYDNTIFHRIISEFVVQGGGYRPSMAPISLFDPIVNESGNGLTNDQFTIAMARDFKPHSADSQFYFNLADNTNLNPSARRWGYAVFGVVVEGEDVVTAMSQVATATDNKTGWSDVPLAQVVLKKATLLKP